MKNTRKLVVMMLVFLLALSNAFFGVRAANAETKADSKQILSKRKAPIQSKDLERFKEKDVVRVIVELDGKPAIEYATEKGLRYKDLSKSKKSFLQVEAKQKQSSFISKAKEKKLNLKVENSFTTVVNGVSGKIEYGKIDELKKLPNVAKVYIANEYKRPEVKPQMITSKDLVGTKETWNLKYKGKGMVVGIIDTGIDPSHKDMILAEDTKPKLTEKSVSDIISKDKLSGKYYTLKVPYGYNYADKNVEIRDLGPDASMHGMHVAGTVAANGDEKNGGIQGVAPEAQLLALKVFSNDPGMPSTYGDIYIKAIDDGIKLGADVLNMSLGSPASFVAEKDPEQQAIKRAVDNGVLMSISAGNSANFGDGVAKPYASNPDIGLVGAPSVAGSSISVASFENSKMQVDGLEYTINGETTNAAFLSASSKHPKNEEQKTFDILAAGIGNPEDFAGKDFKEKYALIQRGTIDFVAKTKNAQAAGAAGVIIYNNQSGIVNMASDASINIPQLFMLQEDGEKLKAALDSGKKVSIQFKGGKTEINNPDAGKMSAFTSWGVTPNLDFKPEITAPGGQIYSTLNNNEYGLMSGTSMAAPHVSGGSALVLEYVKEKFSSLKGADKVNRAKTLLMNTANPLVDPAVETFYSPRRQGAGLMKLDAAVTTPVYVTKKGTNDAKVALKEIKSNQISFTLTATNYSNKDVTYQVDTKPLTDLIEKGENQLASQEIKDAKVTISTPELTVPKGKSKDVKITIDLSKVNSSLSKLMKNGYFVEGFVTFTSPKESGIPNLTVPYTGFKGDWNKPPVLDSMVYDDDTFYGISGMVDKEGNYLGQDPLDENAVYKNKIAISPNGDGINDEIIPLLTFLRNSKTVEYSILDKSKKQVRNLHTAYDMIKNYFNSKVDDLYAFDPHYTTWDGKVNNTVVPDGQYYYQLKTQIDYPGKKPQVVQVPVIVDTKKPEISKLSYDRNSSTLAFTASDKNGSGISHFEIYSNNKLVKAVPALDNKTSYRVEVPELSKAPVIVYAIDYAGNKNASATGDDKIPYITVETPEPLSISNKREVAFTGYVVEESGIDQLTVKGDQLVDSTKKISLKWNKDKNRYEFNSKLTFKKDGVHEISVSGVDYAGNHIEFKRQVIIDQTAPTMKVKGLPSKGKVNAKTNKVTLTTTVADNFDQMRFTVNGNEVYTHEFKDPYKMRKFSHNVKLTLPLKTGKNIFVLEVEDIAGTVTKKEIVIERLK